MYLNSLVQLKNNQNSFTFTDTKQFETEIKNNCSNLQLADYVNQFSACIEFVVRNVPASVSNLYGKLIHQLDIQFSRLGVRGYDVLVHKDQTTCNFIPASRRRDFQTNRSCWKS